MVLQGRLQRDVNWVKVLPEEEMVHSQRDVNRVKMLQEEEMVHTDEARDGPSYGGKSSKGSRRGSKS